MTNFKNRAYAHNTLATFLNNLAPELIIYCSGNPIEFKKDYSFTKKTNGAIDLIISRALVALNNKRVRCYIENSVRGVFNSLSGSLILKADIWYRDSDIEYSSCSYIHEYHYIYFVGSEKPVPEFTPIELVTEYTLINANNRIHEIDSQLRELHSEKSRLQTLLN